MIEIKRTKGGSLKIELAGILPEILAEFEVGLRDLYKALSEELGKEGADMMFSMLFKQSTEVENEED